MNVNRTPRIGEVYMVTLEGSDSEQSGIRPAVVFQNNIGNRYSPNVIVLPLTSKCKKRTQPTHVFLPADDTGLRMDSMVLCENPVCISKQKLKAYMTTLPQKYMAQVAMASILASSAICYLSQDNLVCLWRRASEMNAAAGW